MKAEIIVAKKFIESQSVGAYVESYRVSGIYSKEHMIATVKSIIENDLAYGCSDAKLDSVAVVCDDIDTVNHISKHLDDIFQYPDIEVSVAATHT